MSEWTERAIREVEANTFSGARGHLRPDGTVDWRARNGAFLPEQESRRLRIAVMIEENRLREEFEQRRVEDQREFEGGYVEGVGLSRTEREAVDRTRAVQSMREQVRDRAREQRWRPPEGPQVPPTPEAPAPPVPTLPRMVRHVTEGGAIRYHPAPAGHDGPVFYARRTPHGVTYLDEEQYASWQASRGAGDEAENATAQSPAVEEPAGGAPGGERRRGPGGRAGIPAWLTGVGGRGLMHGRLQGAAVGAMAAGLTGAAVGGLTNPLHQAIGAALQSGGGTGAGMAQIANGLTSTLGTALQMAAHTGGAVVGGALGLVLGAALGGIAGTLAGALAGTLGTAFGQLGRLAGETVGGVVSIFRDATREALGLADAVMRISANANMGAQSASNLVTTLGALGMGEQQATSMFGGLENQLWRTELRLNAFGVGLQRTKDGSVDWARTLLSASQALQQYDPMIRPMVAQSMLGPQAQQLYPYLQNPAMLQQAAEAQDELSPRAQALQQQWERLTVPLNRVNLMWREIKVEFVSAFLPTMLTGVNFLRGLWDQYGAGVIAWVHELPTRAASGLQRLAAWFDGMWGTWQPRLARFWDGFLEGLNAAIGVTNSLLQTLGAVTGLRFPTLPGISGRGGEHSAQWAQQHPFAQVATVAGGGVQRVAQFAQDHPTLMRVGTGAVLANVVTGGLLGRGLWGLGRAALGGARGARVATAGAEVAAASGGWWSRLFGGGRAVTSAARTTAAAERVLAASAAERAAMGGGMFAEGWGTYAQTAARGARVLPWAARVGLPRALGTIAAPLAAVTGGLEGYREGSQARFSWGGLLSAAGGGALAGLGFGPWGALIGAVGGAASYGIGQWLGRRSESGREALAARRRGGDLREAALQQEEQARATPRPSRWEDFFRNLQESWRQAEQQTRQDLMDRRREDKTTLEVQVRPTSELYAQIAAKEVGENVRVLLAGVVA